MKRKKFLLLIALIVLALIAIPSTNKKGISGERSYYGVIMYVSSTQSSTTGQDDYAITILGPDDVPMKERTSWCFSVDARDIDEYNPHPGQLVRYQYANELHTGINVVEYYK